MIPYAEYIIVIAKILVLLGTVVGMVPVMIWMERKGAAYIQDRRGPNRAAILGIRLGGLIHSLADSIKLLTKMDVTGSRTLRPMFTLAPLIALSVPLLAIAVIPFAKPTEIAGLALSFQIANLKSGQIYVLAISSLGVYALLLGGWASFGKYSLIGALRASAQTISYAVAMGLSLVPIFLVCGSLELNSIVEHQGQSPWTWNFVKQPISFLIFTVAMFAETNRLPFDLPEGESELVAGYHTEYSSMRFAMFFMGEYAHIIVGSFIIACLFLGGWQFPFVSVETLTSNIDRTLLIIGASIGIPLLLASALILLRFVNKWRRYGDTRDYESLIMGILTAIIGLALPVSSIFIGTSNITLTPDGTKLIVFLIQFATTFLKAMIFACLFIWVRWTLPRFRYDQLMNLGWKILMPLGLINIILTAAVMLIV